MQSLNSASWVSAEVSDWRLQDSTLRDTLTFLSPLISTMLLPEGSGSASSAWSSLQARPPLEPPLRQHVNILFELQAEMHQKNQLQYK